MIATVEASRLMSEIARPMTVKAAMYEIAQAVSKHLPKEMGVMTPSRAEDIFRQDRVRVRAEELDAIRAAAEARRAKEHNDAAIRAEMAVALARLESVEAAFAGDDAELARAEIHAAREQVLLVGRLLEGGGQ
ncbi:hypothetical protein GCM10008171_32640 [Methylopila jiangsuensis]|uniref:Uncharacterized protein n=2 Tax=Methylopila jiangsuensis TaxID=586230 RepID=A0A9W6N538_9HYPH|nr:hypothetical protein GCM10008171_32640 [Methylopila jiangsuensis]